ncbi:MAG TPA: universal stress protein [Gemmatales bacterium]|nr:universal stress protein [Gemmatales bacterium]
MTTWPPKIILHPTDFSPNAEQALKLACQIAESANATIVVLHAYMIEALSTGDLPVIPHEMVSEEDVRRKLRQILESKSGLKIEDMFIEGTPVETIVSKAQSCHADLIVMGTYGRTGFKRLFLGSVADHVLRRAPCPVLIVPLSPESNVKG